MSCRPAAGGVKQGAVIFLYTWSKDNFSNEEMIDLELLFCVYLIGLIWEIQDYVSQLKFEHPFELQVKVGCELHYRKTTKGFFQAAYQGSDFLSFQNMSWVLYPEGKSVCDLINQYEGIKETVHKLISNICP
ncbi:hypothetical protein Celaphus_00001848, partial [Cervus elaphus hippelaphus]